VTSASRAPIRILDFGCGWGRISRFFERDTCPGDLTGVDVQPAMIEWCRSLDPWASYQTIDTLPPTGFADASFDLIYAYGVLSHLSPRSHSAWVEEFGRLLRPGGFVIATTRARHFLEGCAWVRTEGVLSPANAGAWFGFKDTAGWLDRYDAGEFCYDPTPDVYPDSAELYGEAVVPEPWVRANWPASLVIDEFIMEPIRCEQSVIVAHRA
jgi:SAM-dependent methyltransferase